MNVYFLCRYHLCEPDVKQDQQQRLLYCRYHLCESDVKQDQQQRLLYCRYHLCESDVKPDQQQQQRLLCPALHTPVSAILCLYQWCRGLWQANLVTYPLNLREREEEVGGRKLDGCMIMTYQDLLCHCHHVSMFEEKECGIL